MKNITLIKKCQICNNQILKALDLGNHPLCDDLLKLNSKKKNEEYPIIIKFCKNCKTAFQKLQVKKKILFPKNYHYRARFTNDVVNGQKEIVRKLKKFFGSLQNLNVLDIGCNDGTLLNFFKKEKANTIGIEPTNAYEDASKVHKIFPSYLNEKICKKIINKFKHIDIITFTNVFAHINNLDEVLKCLKILSTVNTVILIENHYLGSVLKKKQFDTFYHEHPRTYSLNSFIYIAKKLGLYVQDVSFPRRYGGNIRVILSKKKKNKSVIKKINLFENSFYIKLKKLQKEIKFWKINKRKEILKLNNKFGPLPAKAFPGRAAILLKLLKLDEKNISAIHEKVNSKKIGCYAPATRIPIVSDKNLNKIDKNIPIINLAWHIDKEIKKYLKQKKFFNKVITIITKKDFKK